MILQSALLSVRPESASEFESSFRKAQHMLTGARGYISHELNKCVEKNGQYLLLVQWQSVGDHVAAFVRSQGYAEWEKALSPFYAEEPQSDHYVRIRLDGQASLAKEREHRAEERHED